MEESFTLESIGRALRAWEKIRNFFHVILSEYTQGKYEIAGALPYIEEPRDLSYAELYGAYDFIETLGNVGKAIAYASLRTAGTRREAPLEGCHAQHPPLLPSHSYLSNPFHPT